MRVLIAGFQHETNTFARSKAAYENFVLGEYFPALSRGTDVLALRNVNIPIAGFINKMESKGHQLIPIIWAGASPSAHVTKEAYERIAGEIIAAAKANDFEAIYLDLHGAMVAEHIDDGEGELLERLRHVVGPNLPIIVSLDLHANVTDQMLKNADGLVAFRTYPHIDMAQTGERAAVMLEELISNDKKLHLVSRRLPFLIPINSMSTLFEPARSVYQQLSSLERETIVSLSFAPGFPAADFAECGPVLWGYGFDNKALEKVIDALFEEIVTRELEWAVQFWQPEEAVREAQRLSIHATRPVVIADTQDNPGAGGSSDTMGMLRALIHCRAEQAAIGLIYDPHAATAAHRAGLGNQITLTLGGQSGVAGDTPLRAKFRVEYLSDGSGQFDGPMLNGMKIELGPVACLKIDDIRVVVSSLKAQMIDRNLYRIAGVQPENMKILVNKSSVHFRADFEPIAEAVLIAKAPGMLFADPVEFTWTRLTPGIRISPGGIAFESLCSAS